MADITETVSSELLPCPFCGSDRITVQYIRDGQQAICKDCRSQGSATFHGKGGPKETWQRAIAAWNTRSAVPDGWAMVPMKATSAMEEAHFAAHAAAQTVFASVEEIWSAMLAAAPPIPQVAGSELVQHQQRVAAWMQECFGPEITADKVERADRFIEEALELAQATGWTADRGHALVDYVFGRPVGEIGQEVGGIMVTLAALCNVFEIDIEAEAKREVDRITQPEVVLKIRAKQAAKPTGSALPVATQTAPDVVGLIYDLEREAVCFETDTGVDQEADAGTARLLRRAIAALRQSQPVQATHRHVKRGTEYVLIGIGKMQAESWIDTTRGDFAESVDMREVAIYRSVDDGSLWVRPREEFEDGRFAVLTAAVGDGK